MQQRTFTRNGVIYQDNGDGTATVVGYDTAATPVGPPNPTLPYQVPKADADARKAQADAQAAAAQAPYVGPEAAAAARKAEADARIAEANAAAEAEGRVKQTAASRQEALKGFQDTRLLDQAISELETLYRQGPGATSGIFGAGDYLPTESNQRFDRAGNQVRAFVKGVLQFTGQENNTPAEALMNFGPYVPQARDYDGTISDKITALKRLRDSGYQRAVQLLGGVPDQTGQVIPLPAGAPPTRDTVEALLGGQDPLAANTNALGQIRTTGGGAPQTQAVPLADSNSVQYRTVDDPALSRAHDELVRSLLAQNGGRLDPEEYAAQFSQLTSQFGYNDPTGPQGRAQWATALNEYLDSGGRTIQTGLSPREQMTAAEIARNNLINNPFTGTAVGVANGLSGGLTEALAPGQFAALRDSQGVPVLAGEVGGAIAGTKGLGAIGRAATGRVAPSLLGGGATGQALRNVAVDGTYGAIYGQNTRGDPATGAAIGVGGSIAGQGIARGLGAAVGGLNRTAAAQALREKGVPISVARQIGLGRVEDLSQSIPLVGDVSRARQLDSFTGFDRAAATQAGEPIGFVPTQTGQAGSDDLLRAAGNARSSVMDGRTIPVDAPFLNQVANAVDPGIPANVTAPVERLLGTRMNRVIQDDALTGDNYATTMSNLKANRANPSDTFKDYTPEFRQSMTNAMDSVSDLIRRSGNDEVIANLNRANTAYRDAKIIQDATRRAKVGTGSGEVDIYTPAQLKQAVSAAEARGYGRSGLTQLANDGQQVLPSTVPNSGTADRTLFAGLLGAAGLAGTGGGYANDQSLAGAAEGAGTGVGGALGIAGILAALGTRRGQQVLEKILISRPNAAQAVGQGIRRRGGLFGKAGGILAQPGPDTIQAY